MTLFNCHDSAGCGIVNRKISRSTRYEQWPEYVRYRDRCQTSLIGTTLILIWLCNVVERDGASTANATSDGCFHDLLSNTNYIFEDKLV